MERVVWGGGGGSGARSGVGLTRKWGGEWSEESGGEWSEE